MPKILLVIGNRNYSSWSLRGWLTVRMTGLDFEEELIPLDTPETEARIRAHSPAGLVPVLHHGPVTVWESLAICEYAAELAPEAGLWPEPPEARAVARAVSAEMHAGFRALRDGLPMNIRASRPDVVVDDPIRRDIARICQIWQDCRDRFGAGGRFLFGRFSIADAMFAPVVTRFATYHVGIGGIEQDYCDAVRALPGMREWADAAAAEPWVIEAEEIGRP